MFCYQISKLIWPAVSPTVYLVFIEIVGEDTTICWSFRPMSGKLETNRNRNGRLPTSTSSAKHQSQPDSTFFC
ncbi:hypothetical protein P3S67_005925 [Capsicum chacoense]